MPRRLPDKTKRTERPGRFKGFIGSRFPSEPFQSSPVKVGQEIDVVIDDIGSRGDGITRIQGYLIFVPKARVGERLRVKILSTKGGFALAEKIG